MKHRIVYYSFILIFLLQSPRLLAQGWEKLYPSQSSFSSSISSIVETPDSGFVFAKSELRLSPYNGHMLSVNRIDKFGTLVWQYKPSDILVSDTIRVLRTSDNGFMVIVTEIKSLVLTLPSILMIKLNNQGVEQFRKYYLEDNVLIDADIDGTRDRISVITKRNNDRLESGGYLIEATLNGDTLRTTFFRNVKFESLICVDNHQYISNRNLPLLSEHLNVIKVDSLGNQVWSRTRIGYWGTPTRLKKGLGKKILVSGNWVLDSNGNTVWTGALIHYGNNFTSYRNNNHTVTLLQQADPTGTTADWYFIKRDSMGIELSRVDFKSEDYQFKDIIATSDSGFIIFGHYGLQGRTLHACLIKVNSEGSIYANTIKGKFFIDSIQNCSIETYEKGFPQRLVSIEKNNNTQWAKTDSYGNYEIQVDTGNYTIRGILPNSNWRFCTPSVNKQLTSFGTTDTVNFAAQALVFCPQLRVSTATSGLRRCFDNNYYTIRYTNEGTQAAQNAYITLKLDSLLEYINATRPLSNRQGQTLRFDMGTVPIGSEGSFSVRVRVRCGDSTRLGQALCTEAHIFPDTFCVPTPNWSGANIIVNGRCDRDSVRFLIQNTGNVPSSLLKRQIVEDEIVFLNGLISVPANGSQTISLPANGKTWQLFVQQEPNHPLSNHPTAVVEGCRLGQNQPFSTGFVNQFPTDDGSPTIDNVCSAIIGSFDPNDKEGLPLGYKTAHFIEPNQDIEYRIRFQNTGTDTAFTIVVRDTLSDFLNISSLKMGASSHRFDWMIEDKNVLVFRFSNILLPDSFRNEAASHGFVTFKISQKKDLALGTKITNQANIYFDFNAPIRTNKTTHTIGKDFIITALQTVSTQSKVEIKVYPNPFNADATIDLQGFNPLSISNQFYLFDALGRQIRHEKFGSNQFLFERRDLLPGIYFFKIENNSGQTIGIGKFLVK
ncbi:MAG: T9SS type A sorting domain-containing protein [Saprospiraceae bacterium]|nr:T9SS type A sorting domain-containing protein [Saprospiraceae bacterium]